MEPWDATENQETKCALDDKIEKRFVNQALKINRGPNLLCPQCFQQTENYGPLFEMRIESISSKTFANFGPFIIAEYVKLTRHTKSTVCSVCLSIANQITADISNEDLHAWAISNIANFTKL